MDCIIIVWKEMFLKLLDWLPPFHSVPRYTIEDEDYFLPRNILETYFDSDRKYSPSKLMGSVCEKKKLVTRDDAQKIGIKGVDSNLSVINLVSVLHMIMKITENELSAQSRIIHHIIDTFNKPIDCEIGGNGSSWDDEEQSWVEFFAESEEEIDEDNTDDENIQNTTITNQMLGGSDTLEEEEDLQNQSQMISNSSQNILQSECVNNSNTESLIAKSNSENRHVITSSLCCCGLHHSHTSSQKTTSELSQNNGTSSITIPGFECTSCHQDAKLEFVGKYKGIETITKCTSRERKRAKFDLNVFQNLLLAQGHSLHAWFNCLIQTNIGRKQVIEIMESAHGSEMNNLRERLIFQRHINEVLYWKDNNLISFESLHNLRKECRFMKELPARGDVQKQKVIIDQVVEKLLKISCPSDNPEHVGYLASIDAAIVQIFALYKALGGKKLESKNKIYFKLCVDGREVNGIKQVGVVLVPLNMREVFPLQAVSSVFYIGLFQMTETQKSLKETIGTLVDELKQIPSTLYNNDQTNVKVFYVSDMHNLGMTFDYEMCPYCLAERVQDFNSKTRESLDGFLPFLPTDIFMCVLHVKQRLVENTVAYCASASEYKDLITNNLKKLPGLENFAWREFKKRVTEYGNPTTVDRGNVKCSMLSGDRCDVILNNFSTLFENIDVKPTRDKYHKVFELLHDIIKLCEMKKESDILGEETITEGHIQKLENFINQFLVETLQLWSVGVKSHYYHYIIHLPDMLQRLANMGLSLAAISNQGFERSHLFHHSVFNRIILNSNAGRGMVKNHATKQLLLWQWRKVYLALDLFERTKSTYWENKLLKKKHKKNKTIIQERIQSRIDLYSDVNPLITTNSVMNAVNSKVNQLGTTIPQSSENSLTKNSGSSLNESENSQISSNLGKRSNCENNVSPFQKKKKV